MIVRFQAHLLPMGEENLSQLPRCLAIPSDRNFKFGVLVCVLICYVRQGESTLSSSTVFYGACTHGMALQQKRQPSTLECRTETD